MSVRDQLLALSRSTLYAVAVGMPYRWQASKEELADWLLRYRPEVAEQLTDVTPRH